MSFREGRLPGKMSRDAAEYTSSLKDDAEIYRATILINAVHLKMLGRLGLVTQAALEEGLRALRELYERPIELSDPNMEDVHIVIEEHLSRRAPEAGWNLALGKSRNDAVATAIRMRLRERILSTVEGGIRLLRAMLERAEAEAETVFPVYTHMQAAAPASLGFILASHASRIIGGMHSLVSAYKAADRCPLGAAAVAGTSVPLDRAWMARQLGFSAVLENALEASSSRDFFVDAFSGLIKTMSVVSDLSEELVVYSTSEFGLIELPDEYSSTSSIMPQKKNPVVPEVGRTKLPEVLAETLRALMITSRRFSGYVLDLQQATPSLWRAFDASEATLRLYSEIIGRLSVNRERAYNECGAPAGIVELATRLSVERRIPFRSAHRACGVLSRLMSEGRLDEEALRSVLSGIGVENPPSLGEVMGILEPRSILESYRSLGSANPSEVRRMVSAMRAEVEGLESWARGRAISLQRAVAGAFDP